MRTDIGRDNDVDVKPAAVGGVEFGFRGAPRLKVSAELSLAGEPDLDDRRVHFGVGSEIDLAKAAGQGMGVSVEPVVLERAVQRNHVIVNLTAREVRQRRLVGRPLIGIDQAEHAARRSRRRIARRPV